jgi:Ca2+-binding RTX toxin-like protein
MNQAMKGLDGLDAILNDDIDDFNNLSNNTAYYIPASTTQAAPANHSSQNMASTQQAAPAANSLQNMIGLSQLIYSDGSLTKRGTLPGLNALVKINGTIYTVIDEENDDSGYQGLTLFDKSSKTIIVVNKGTQTAQNWATDAGMAFTTTNNQWQGAYALGSRVAALATANGATAIYATGHSLGGTLTQMQAAYFGWQGYTFNAYGANEVYTKLGLAISSNEHITNYRTMFDLVSDASTHIGDPIKTIETPQDVSLLGSFYDFFDPAKSVAAEFLVTIGKDHFISNFYGASDSAGSLLSGGDNVFSLAQGFALGSPPPQVLAIAEDIISSMAELIHFGMGVILGVGPFQSGNLTLQQSAEEVMQFINNEPVSGIKTVVPSDPSLLSHALDPAIANNAYRASLASLTPAVLQGLDPTSFVNASLWAPGQTTGLTKDYLIARNSMVQAMIALAGAGQQGGTITTSNTNSYVYTDLARSPSPMYTLNGHGGSTYDVIFADNKVGFLTVAAGVNAELFGGSGNDTLNGGTVGSTMQGGAGNDVYVIDGTGTGVDYILDTDGQGSIEWKSADGSTKTLTGGAEQLGTAFWKSADGLFTYSEDLAADGSTGLEILSGNKIAYVDNFTNGELGINLSIGPSVPPGTVNLPHLKDDGLVGDTTPGGTAHEVYEDSVPGALVGSIYGSDSTENAFGNEILGEGNASFVSAGNGNNTVLLGSFYQHATDPTATALSATVQGGSGNQDLIGVGNGTETITGGAVGTNTAAITYIDGGGATADLAGGGQNSVIFGGTGADTLAASTSASPAGFNPFSIAIAGLSFWGSVYSSHQGGSGGTYVLGSLPEVNASASSSGSVQINLSLYQTDGTYATPFNLLGSSMDSGAAGSTTLPGSVLIGGTGQDWLIGNSGNDTIIGGQPTHPVSGTTDEVLVGGAGADVIYGGGGSEIIYADMGPGDVAGWADLDPSHADTIYGGTGTDFIYGSGGKDVIYGGSGIDVIHAGNGATYIDSGSGNTSIYGGTGNDTIIADAATGFIQTGDGNSYVKVANGNSTIVAGAGHDTIEAAGGNALITEGSGLTTIIAGSSTGSDTIHSGSGGAAIQLTDGLTESALVARDVNGDLVLSDPGFDTQITVSGYFNTNTGVSLQFADGKSWGAAEILQASIKPRSDGGNDTLVGSNGSDSITAGFGDTSIVGVSGNNTLTGGAGSDSIQGGSGTDMIEGGSGTTQIVGGTGSETYVFNLGDGSDTIRENVTSTGNDVLRLGAGIMASNLSFIYDSSSNIVQIGFGSMSASTITFANFVATQANQHQLTKLVFADGTSLSQLQMIQQAVAINGTTGNDSLTGTSGMNYFEGKGGNDVEVGNGGNDTFVFNAGYGHLAINESYATGQQPVLQLGAGITASALRVTTDGTSVLLTDGTSGDQVTVDNMWSTSANGIASVQLADGTTLTLSQLIQMEMTGTTGTDSLYGTAGANLLDGKGGNDSVIGGGGSDTFVFNSGYGHLEINEVFTSDQTPVLQLGAGLTTAALHVTTNGTNLVLTDSVSGDQVTLDKMWSTSGDGVATVKLSNGSTLTRAQLIQMEMIGTTGNDTITGTSGADLIDGKGGSDSVTGAGGSDTFVFNSGYGHLEINEVYISGQTPVLQLGTGITASALHVTTDGYSLFLADGISGDQIILDYANSSNGISGVQTVAFADGTTLTAAQLVQMANDITGTTGNDTLSGTSGADQIDGKGGNDLVLGYGGSDTFVFNAGYGQLAIDESYTSGQQPVLQLGAGITASALQATTDGYNLLLTDGITGDKVNLESMWENAAYGVAEVQLADGTTLTRNQLLQLGTTTVGTTGNDTMYGTAGAELFDGKGGNDYVNGGGGSDTFVFNSGYGKLTINENNDPSGQHGPAGTFASGKSPVLQLGTGITLSDLRVSLGNDLYITDGISGDQITLTDEAIYGDYGVAAVQLADGTTLTAAQLLQMAHTITGTTGSDTLYGTSDADIIDGKGGGDLVYGGGGDDAVMFNPGYGTLEINEFGSAYAVIHTPLTSDHPLVKLGVGVNASMLHVTVSPGYNQPPNQYGGYAAPNNIVITDGISGDKISLDNMWDFNDASLNVLEFSDGSTLTVSQLEHMQISGGTTGNDVIYGTLSDDLIDGKGGNDTVYGSGLSGDSNVTYSEYDLTFNSPGGPFYDGNDTFVFNAGYGQLHITEQYTNDHPILQLGTGITASSLHVTSNGPSLVLTDGISGDQVTLNDMFSGGTGWGSTWGVSAVKLADGSTLTASQLIQMEMTGTAGNDTFYGTSGANLLDGKGGNDSIVGGGGNDTFVFNAGYGYLTINESYYSSQQPVLQLGTGIAASALHVTSDGTDLFLTDGISGDQITLIDMLRYTSDGVAAVQLADGTTLTAAQLLQMEMTGTTRNDTLYGTSGADLIDGKGGNDSVVGNGGNDTFVFNVGYGHLEINESYTTGSHLPVLQLGAGITASALRVTESSGNLVLADGVTGDQITLDKMWSSSNSGYGVAMVQLADGTTLTAAQLIQMEMTGTPGNDTLNGTSGADLIDGKGGNDSVVGGGGNDTFVFNTGYGHLEINEVYTSGQTPVLRLGAGITASALHVTESSNNLILTDGVSGDQVTLDKMWSTSTDGVALVHLADGTTLTRSQLIQMEMTGTPGNDTLNGTSGADLIDGKGGNDSVIGGGGNDTFVFNSGYGHLTINETYTSGQTPVLQLGAGITASALHVTETSNNLMLTDGVSGDQITLNTMWSSATHGVATVKLADGTVFTRSQLIQMEMTGTTGNDTLYGTSGADLIDGKGGSDSVVGGGGSDTFVFNSGYGHLEINEVYTSGQLPVLQLGTGLTTAALHVTTNGTNLVLTDGVSGDQVTLDKMWSTSGNGVATVKLSNGTTLTRAQLIQMEMIGTTANDTITGTSGADLIDGKGGSDSVTGAGGSDTFVFNSGYGHLTINETYTSGQAPVLQLGAGITTSTLKVTKSGNNLLLTDGVTSDQITLNNMSLSSTSGVATVKLANGTSLTRSQLIAMEPAAVMKTSSAPLATSGSGTLLQINPLIHAIASYTGNRAGGDSMTSAMIPPVTADVMLHAAA